MHFWPKLTHPAALSFCDSWATCYIHVACQQWTTEVNTVYWNGQGNPASTVALCKASCISNAECTGFDWVAWQAENARCWLSGSWSGGKNRWPGVTHYDLNRNCSGNKFDSLLCIADVPNDPSDSKKYCVITLILWWRASVLQFYCSSSFRYSLFCSMR